MTKSSRMTCYSMQRNSDIGKATKIDTGQCTSLYETIVNRIRSDNREKSEIRK